MIQVLTKAVEQLGLDWSAPEEPACSLLDEWFLQPGRAASRPLVSAQPLYSQRSIRNTIRCGAPPYLARVHSSYSATLSTVDGTKEKGSHQWKKLSLRISACPWLSAGRLKLRILLRSAGPHQRSPLEHSPPMDRPPQHCTPWQFELALFKELCSATDLALRATKATAEAIGRAISSLVVLEHYLWLKLTDPYRWI